MMPGSLERPSAGRSDGEVLELLEQEYERLERELHQGLAQELGALVFRLRHLRREVGGEPIQSFVDKACQAADRAVSSGRGVMADLRVSLLFEEGLDVALEDLLRREAGRAGCPMRFQYTEGFRLERESALCVYRITQDLLRILVKHPAPARIALKVARAVDAVTLTLAVASALAGEDRSTPPQLPPTLVLRLGLLQGTLSFPRSRTGAKAVLTFPISGYEAPAD